MIEKNKENMKKHMELAIRWVVLVCTGSWAANILENSERIILSEYNFYSTFLLYTKYISG